MDNIVSVIFVLSIAFLIIGCGSAGGFCSADPLEAMSGRLIGAGKDEVLDKLGVPVSICCSNQHSEWGYFDAEGNLYEDAVLFHGNCVVGINPEIERFADPEPIPTSEPFMGQRVEDYVGSAGELEGFSNGAFSVNLDYSDMTLVLNGGRIVGIERK